MREPCCSVGFSSEAHFPKGATWYVSFLPKGYAITPFDRAICAFSGPVDGSWDDYGLGRGELPPLIEAVCRAIEEHMAKHPSDWHKLQPTSHNKGIEAIPE